MPPTTSNGQGGAACLVRNESLPLAAFIANHVKDNWYTWAIEHYKQTIIALVRTYGCRSLLEIGGGRAPLLTREEVQEMGLRYTVNDISQHELDLCPDWADKVCFDISGDSAPAGQYDLAFSRMVLEHVRDAGCAYRNMHRLLRFGGIGMHLHPTLFAPPFVINYVLPTALSDQILRAFGARLSDSPDAYPKFPAHYSWCRSTGSVIDRIGRIGFRDVQIARFYGHGYFRKIPGVCAIDDMFSRIAMRKGSHAYTSYAYTMVRR
jgi:SAM-dependent methyltransferase